MDPLSATDRCVKCGLCLPHCPTFALTGNEADSPRGRISLMQLIAEPEPRWSPGLFLHLDRCLQCGACEAMCPSAVPFGQLMDAAQTAAEAHRERPLLSRLTRSAGLGIIRSPRWIRLLAPVVGAYQKMGLQALLAKTPGLPATFKRLNRLLPEIQSGHTPAGCIPAQKRGRVYLFTGCLGNLFDRQTLAATQRLLARLGYEVVIPGTQTCCGALHQHNGDPATAAELAQANHDAFGADNAPVLVTASGCAAHLLDYPSLYGQQPAGALAARVSDSVHFLVRQDISTLRFATPAEPLAVHIPCTHRNALRQEGDVLEILKWIPDHRAVFINPKGGCCGAAGSYMLSQPEMSDRLADQLIETILGSGAKTILTTNLGCSIQLKSGLKQRGEAIDVLHPVTLLDRLLIDTDP
jgi:glycolate oxidase iron-sulfur subunit